MDNFDFIRDTLTERYPVIAECRPLRKHIDQQIIPVLHKDKRFSKRKLRQFLQWHTSRYEYLENCQDATVRYNLDGSPVELTEVEIVQMQTHARTSLKISSGIRLEKAKSSKMKDYIKKLQADIAKLKKENESLEQATSSRPRKAATMRNGKLTLSAS